MTPAERIVFANRKNNRRRSHSRYLTTISRCRTWLKEASLFKISIKQIQALPRNIAHRLRTNGFDQS
ncbi:TPA: hypothetical protein DDZ10_02145 [Candidatus Uhrbacteria bacterium]|nr:MAG: hypothetical protein A3D69_01280 [Candidatus Uhrbacteria bacterium RIFCSPHIGHO2_02_FULL_54_11]HBL39450.1 hypothetical protein [Candidatus Uhrbacteria bacterium]